MHGSSLLLLVKEQGGAGNSALLTLITIDMKSPGGLIAIKERLPLQTVTYFVIGSSPFYVHY
jgi:hypothetical protein